MIQHITIIVSGKVQGVFYRASAKEKAKEIGVKGLVRNEPSGNVYIEAEATAEALTEFVDWCKSGPARAQVQHVEVVRGEEKGFKSFDILR
ncbi:MAG: acylphosphatase [Bacteroidia bacterium]|nr:acylphosphatase [Bacteroidia bacterium]